VTVVCGARGGGSLLRLIRHSFDQRGSAVVSNENDQFPSNGSASAIDVPGSSRQGAPVKRAVGILRCARPTAGAHSSH
jgi:hypothetical protein